MYILLSPEILSIIVFYLFIAVAVFLLEKDRLRGRLHKTISAFMFISYYILSLTLPALCFIGMMFVSEGIKGNGQVLFSLLGILVAFVPLVATIYLNAKKDSAFWGRWLPLTTLVVCPGLVFGLLILSE